MAAAAWAVLQLLGAMGHGLAHRVRSHVGVHAAFHRARIRVRALRIALVLGGGNVRRRLVRDQHLLTHRLARIILLTRGSRPLKIQVVLLQHLAVHLLCTGGRCD